MYVTRGWTKPEKRKYVLGEYPVVERIAEVCAHHERAVFHFPVGFSTTILSLEENRGSDYNR